MGLRVFGEALERLGGSSKTPVLTPQLAAFVEQVTPNATTVAIHRMRLKVIDEPGHPSGPEAGAVVAQLYASERANAVANRGRDLAKAALALAAIGYHPRSTGRLSSVNQRREHVVGADWTLSVETLPTEVAGAKVEFEYIRAPHTAPAPEGWLSRRTGVEREPVGARIMLPIDKEYMLVVQVGSNAGEMARYSAQRVRDVLARRTAIKPTKIAQDLHDEA